MKNACSFLPAYDDAEMKAVTSEHPDFGAAWRQRDFDYVTSEAFKSLLKQKGIILANWTQVQKSCDQDKTASLSQARGEFLCTSFCIPLH